MLQRRKLAPREKQVAELAAHGLGNAEVAARLGLSKKTVNTYMHRILVFFKIDSRKDLRKCLDRYGDESPKDSCLVHKAPRKSERAQSWRGSVQGGGHEHDGQFGSHNRHYRDQNWLCREVSAAPPDQESAISGDHPGPHPVFRAEFFNLFNHPQFDVPYVFRGNNPQSGQITQGQRFWV